MEPPWKAVIPTMDEDVNKLFQELIQEVYNDCDDAEKVLQTLHKYGFHELPEDTKFYILYYRAKIDESEIYNRTIFHEVVHGNKINTMIALLRSTTYSFVCSLQRNSEYNSRTQIHRKSQLAAKHIAHEKAEMEARQM